MQDIEIKSVVISLSNNQKKKKIIVITLVTIDVHKI